MNLTRSADSKLHQMIHESLQANIIRKDRLRSLAYAAITARGMCGRWIEFGKEETSLGSTGIADDEPREWESVLNEFL